MLGVGEEWHAGVVTSDIDRTARSCTDGGADAHPRVRSRRRGWCG